MADADRTPAAAATAPVRGRWREIARQSNLLGADGTLASTIFAEMSALAARTGAVNLGQGFPDTDGPRSILDGAVAQILGANNQYPPGRGVPALRRAVAEHQRRFYGLEVDPDTEVLVTAGATEAIAACVMALVEPGDEVVTLEPYYDSYAASVALAGAVRRTVPLRFPDYRLDVDALAAAVTPRTRLVLLNSPHNPTGHVLGRAELEAVARVAVEHDLLVVTDEVYEHLTFDGIEHVPLATLPGMAGRVVTISSAGKTFSVTGWKVGWVVASKEVVDAVTTVKQFLTYVNAGPFQPAVADALALGDDFYTGVATRLQAGRDALVEGLLDVGFTVSVPQGTYFVVADAAPLGYADGLTLCRELPERAGVVGVPVQVFHDDVEAGRSLVRFAFCKRPEVIADAVARLKALHRG
ncbi:pyridoxal phosphate-dependent aminotransferase [Kineosporia sp. A_224]|uniref:pyridoxal phosphate-dependent aminotransferase n=1 Tax=Kineosporia sp. A_224 TaxID=1962180 RepID=UPI000B4B9895|nr:pyridoxal phosphate-dependent aminotransferase [Kineosporia sp. A_224]